MVRTEHEPHIASYDSNKHICKPPNSIESNTNPGYTRKKTHFNDVFTHAIVNFRWQHLACPHHNIIILRLLQFWLQINFHLPRSLILRTICNRNVEKYLIGPIRGVKMQFFFLKILILTRSHVDLVFWRLESIQWS